MDFSRNHFILFFASAILAACGGNTGNNASAPGTPEGKGDRVYTISMNKICKEWDGQWQGMTVASDGSCYFGSSTHSKGHGAGFHRFDPSSWQHTMLAADMTYVCGEQDTPSQQGKIHSPIVECDGWLYFTTHLSNYWKEGIENYAGAHVMGYNLQSGEFRDLGIVKPRYSIYSAIGVDPVRRKLYVFLVPFLDELFEQDGCHLYSIDIDTCEKKDLGLVVPGRKGAAFWFFVDKGGDVWFSLWKKHYDYENDRGNLYVYRAEKDTIETFVDVLPKGKLIDGTPVSDETLLGCARQFYGMKEVLKAHDAVAISVNCLGGCYTGKLHAYPCLGFMELQDLGLFGTCENDIRSTTAMVVFGAMTKGRMGYISDPAIDSSRRAMIFAHCVATRKYLGTDGPTAPYEIETHSEDRMGASVRSIAPVNYPVTTVQFHFFGDGGKGCALVQTGRTFSNDPDDRACRTKMVVEVTGDFERSYKLWDLWGWHRVTFLGDFKKDVEALAKKIGYRVIYES